MHATLRLLLLLLISVHLNAADSVGGPVDLGASSSLRTGTQLREKREVRVQEGKGRMQKTNSANDFFCRFVQRVNLVRRLLGPDTEEVQVREMVCELVNYTGNAPPPAEQAGPLVGKTLRLRKSNGKWKYAMVGGKPSAEQQKFLNDLAFTTLMLEIPEACLINQTHKAGETWKVSINESGGKDYGAVIAKDIECTLAAVDQRPDGPQASVHLVGNFIMERPMNYLSRMEVAFDITLVRRLSDMLDLNTKITGNLKNVAQVNDADGKAAQLTLDLPFTLVRSQAIERK
ncbi:MAG: hypothetical protein K9N47_11080 [Prosthecobacter sp.]|uniref:hypothetical protein n=1 Tax=Prosthecobacter sp. TaxID=1965333 RepID=UPI0025FCE661|nr:hypothetical protein [Prosthecobacter sp.]MCF7786656.1 hypothetical protein [Prosthecobacter sp.]